MVLSFEAIQEIGHIPDYNGLIGYRCDMVSNSILSYGL